MSDLDKRRALLIERIEKLALQYPQASELLDLLEGDSLIAQSSAISVEDSTQVSYAKSWETIEDDRHRIRTRFSRWAQKLRQAEGLEETNYEALATAWGQLCLQTATYEVEVYRGAALRDWYIEFGEGGLGSCMTGYDAEDYTALYSEHPDQIGLAIAFRNDRPKARALLWTGLTHPLNSQSVDFLDRIYFVEESAARWLENWATVEGKGLRFPINDTEIQISLGGESDWQFLRADRLVGRPVRLLLALPGYPLLLEGIRRRVVALQQQGLRHHRQAKVY